MTDPIERVARAMQAKRRDLINQPLERIWPDLTRSAIAALRDFRTEDFTLSEAAAIRRFIDAALEEGGWQN